MIHLHIDTQKIDRIESVVLLSFIGGGLIAFAKLNIEAYPNPAPVILEITAQAPGLSAEEMERYYGCGIQGLGRRISRMRAKRCKRKFARGIH